MVGCRWFHYQCTDGLDRHRYEQILNTAAPPPRRVSFRGRGYSKRTVILFTRVSFLQRTGGGDLDLIKYISGGFNRYITRGFNR